MESLSFCLNRTKYRRDLVNLSAFTTPAISGTSEWLLSSIASTSFGKVPKTGCNMPDAVLSRIQINAVRLAHSCIQNIESTLVWQGQRSIWFSSLLLVSLPSPGVKLSHPEQNGRNEYTSNLAYQLYTKSYKCNPNQFMTWMKKSSESSWHRIIFN